MTNSSSTFFEDQQIEIGLSDSLPILTITPFDGNTDDPGTATRFTDKIYTMEIDNYNPEKLGINWKCDSDGFWTCNEKISDLSLNDLVYIKNIEPASLAFYNNNKGFKNYSNNFTNDTNNFIYRIREIDYNSNTPRIRLADCINPDTPKWNSDHVLPNNTTTDYAMKRNGNFSTDGKGRTLTLTESLTDIINTTNLHLFRIVAVTAGSGFAFDTSIVNIDPDKKNIEISPNATPNSSTNTIEVVIFKRGQIYQKGTINDSDPTIITFTQSISNNIMVGNIVTCETTGIENGTTVTVIDKDNKKITLSKATTATLSDKYITFTPFGSGQIYRFNPFSYKTKLFGQNIRSPTGNLIRQFNSALRILQPVTDTVPMTYYQSIKSGDKDVLGISHTFGTGSIRFKIKVDKYDQNYFTLLDLPPENGGSTEIIDTIKYNPILSKLSDLSSNTGIHVMACNDLGKLVSAKMAFKGGSNTDDVKQTLVLQNESGSIDVTANNNISIFTSTGYSFEKKVTLYGNSADGVAGETGHDDTNSNDLPQDDKKKQIKLDYPQGYATYALKGYKIILNYPTFNTTDFTINNGTTGIPEGTVVDSYIEVDEDSGVTHGYLNLSKAVTAHGPCTVTLIPPKNISNIKVDQIVTGNNLPSSSTVKVNNVDYHNKEITLSENANKDGTCLLTFKDTFSLNGKITLNSNIIEIDNPSDKIEIGQLVSVSGIPTDTKIDEILGSKIIISNNATQSKNNVSLTFTNQYFTSGNTTNNSNKVTLIGYDTNTSTLNTMFTGADLTCFGKLNSVSDRRLKSNIQNLKNPLDKVKKLEGKSFTLNNDLSGKKQLGMIAQDVIKIVPELVNEDKNGYFSVNYSNTCALLIEAIKEQQKEIDEIKKIIKEKL